MEVSLNVAVVDQSVPQHKLNLIQDLSASAKAFFRDSSYSSEVETIAISFLLVNSQPGYEDWHKEKSPRYVAFKTVKSRLTGETYDVSKRFDYDIKFSDELIESFSNTSDEESIKIIAEETLASLNKLDKLSKKVKDFDKEKFRADLQKFFGQQMFTR